MHEYEPLQKSVWLGMRPLTREFFEEAREKELLPYLHFFEVSRGGTLE